jgi:cysteine desulfurase
MDKLEEFIYWDNAATTKVDQQVLDAMLPYFTQLYGNPSSNHEFGEIAKNAIENARNQVAQLINADDSEIVFTSGATESINMALKGYVESNFQKGNHIITVKTEHKAVLSTCEYLESRGVEVTYLGVDKDGLISLEELKTAIKPSTLLISVMYVNNEIGVIQPVQQIGKISKEHSIAFFCDATQAIGKIKVDVELDNIDMLSFSGHKIYGPKGVGVLYKKKDILISPLIHGGSQEGGLRAGTYNTPLIIGLGKACEIINRSDLSQNVNYVNKYREKIESEFKKMFVNFSINCCCVSRVCNILSVTFHDIDNSSFNSNNGQFILSNGSACTSNLMHQSHVISQIYSQTQDAGLTLRISFNMNEELRSEDLEKFYAELWQKLINIVQC